MVKHSKRSGAAVAVRHAPPLPEPTPPAKNNRRVLERHRHHKYKRLYLELQSKSKYWQARTFLNGRRVQKTLHPATELSMALTLGAEWYRKLVRDSEHEKPEHPAIQNVTTTMAERFKAFKASLPKKSQQDDADMRWSPIKEFWGHLAMEDVKKSKTFVNFYDWRRQPEHGGVSNHTLQKDTALLRNILNFSVDQEVITDDDMPRIPKFGKIEKRPRKPFSEKDWKRLLRASEERVRTTKNRHTKRQRQDMDDFLRFVEAGQMRVDEVQYLRFDQCELSRNSNGDDILIMNIVISKKGPRPGAVAGPVAAAIYKRRNAEWDGKNPRIFPHDSGVSLRNLLKEVGLYYTEPTNNPKLARNFRSARSTGISNQLLRGVSIFTVASNSGTGIQPIQEFYAKNLRGKDSIDALTNNDLEWRDWRDFPAACEFAKSLGLKTKAEWKAYVQSGEKPADIPGDPATAYRDHGWISWEEWLTGGPVIEYTTGSRWGGESV